MKKRVTITAVAEYDEENFDEEAFTDDQLGEMLEQNVLDGEYPLEPTVESIEEGE